MLFMLFTLMFMVMVMFTAMFMSMFMVMFMSMFMDVSFKFGALMFSYIVIRRKIDMA